MHPIAEWLCRPEIRESKAQELLTLFSEELIRLGVPVWRSSVSIPTMHPEVLVTNLTWVRNEGVTINLQDHGALERKMYLDSPVHVVREGQAELRCKLIGPDANLGYPICLDLKERGGTDYFIHGVHLHGNIRTYFSWATDSEAGFSEENLDVIREAMPVLELLLDSISARIASRSLLEVYLGRNAAQRVVSGSFRRRSGEPIHAVIMQCDLRGFTEFTENHEPYEVIEFLDSYYEIVGNAVHEEGGEILKFIGDAALSIFPVKNSNTKEATESAMKSASEILKQISEYNESEKPHPIQTGIVLNIGEVVYGNIGAKERLDFTIIGSAVNEVFRMEHLCKELGEPVILSEKLAREASHLSLRSLGKFRLRGLEGERQVFAPN